MLTEKLFDYLMKGSCFCNVSSESPIDCILHIITPAGERSQGIFNHFEKAVPNIKCIPSCVNLYRRLSTQM